MAYPFYQPSYQPFSYVPPIQQQPQQPQNSIIWVGGLMEAQSFPVAPNNAVALWEQSGKKIYLKSADATGKPSIRIYDLVERTETASAAPEVKTPDFATKDELAAILSNLKGIASEIEQMKGDLYGVAGRKKASKKEVVDDDE